MDAKTFHLVPINPEPIMRPKGLSSLSPDTIPSLRDLREIEENIRGYKQKHELRLQNCKAQLAVVNNQYGKMKEHENTEVKESKKGI